MSLVLPLEPAWGHMCPVLDGLTSQGVEVRYQGLYADVEDARKALRIAQDVRGLVRQSEIDKWSQEIAISKTLFRQSQMTLGPEYFL